MYDKVRFDVMFESRLIHDGYIYICFWNFSCKIFFKMSKVVYNNLSRDGSEKKI